MKIISFNYFQGPGIIDEPAVGDAAYQNLGSTQGDDQTMHVPVPSAVLPLITDCNHHVCKTPPSIPSSPPVAYPSPYPLQIKPITVSHAARWILFPAPQFWQQGGHAFSSATASYPHLVQGNVYCAAATSWTGEGGAGASSSDRAFMGSVTARGVL
jgi:hypothetical protein